MIQLTKGTNVLDINLSDFSGAGQDVVQNGSFNDIGSDLVQNGDFAEIGSELITNGDFSAVPLGSELVTYPNFTNSDLSQMVMNSGRADKTWDAAEFMRLTFLKNEGEALYAIFGQTLNANYNVKLRVRGTKADGTTAQGSAFSSIGDYGNLGEVISNPTLTSEWQDYEFNVWSINLVFRFYLASAEIGDLVDFDSISVKENTNLVTNPNFTATGSELLPEGASPMTGSWGGTGTIIDGKLVKNGWGIAYLSITNTPGKSYKAIVDVESLDGNTTFYLAGTNSAPLVVGINTIYIVAGINTSFGAGINDGYSSGVGSVINSISVKELGEDWTLVGSNLNITESKLNFVSAAADTEWVQQTVLATIGKSYKVTLDVSNLGVGESLKVRYPFLSSSITTNGTHTLYGVSEAAAVRITPNSATATFSVSNISVQELGEGWNVGTGWSIGDSKATSDGTGNFKSISQSCLVNPLNKSYKITYEVSDYVSGAVRFILGGYELGQVTSSNGIVTEYLKPTNVSTNNFIYLETTGSGFVGSITNISVKEVGQDWTVGDGWTVEDNKAVASPAVGYLYQDNVYDQNSVKYYKLIYSITVDSGAFSVYINGKTGSQFFGDETVSGTYTHYFTTTGDASASDGRLYLSPTLNFDGSLTNISVQQLDTNGRWVTFADPDSKSVMKLGQVDLEIDSSGNNCGVYQTGLIKPNKLYIITINMKATAAIYVEIAASLGTAVSAVIGTELLTTSYKEYSFEYVTPFAVNHDLQIHRLFGSGANQTISIDYVSMNGVDESQWTNDPTWDPFATSLVFVPTLTDESTNNSKQFTLDTSITDGGWDGRSLHGQVIINEFPTEVPASGIINLKQPDFLEGFYQVEIRGYLGTFYRILGKCMAHLERTSTEDGYNRFESYNDTVTYKAYEE